VIEPAIVDKTLSDDGWILAIQEELGIQINQCKDGVYVHQTKYT